MHIVPREQSTAEDLFVIIYWYWIGIVILRWQTIFPSNETPTEVKHADVIKFLKLLDGLVWQLDCIWLPWAHQMAKKLKLWQRSLRRCMERKSG